MLDSDALRKRKDHYGREEFARRIANTLSNPSFAECLVVALDGPWGSGKTWVLDKIEETLNPNPTVKAVKVFRFDPWVIGEESDLILDFLIQMALEPV